MSDALALIGDGSDMIAALVARRKMINKVMDTVMTKGVDFGVIAGCGDKPTLFKPGAEKICGVFGLAPEFIIEDKSGPDLVSFRIKTRLLSNSGAFLGEGVGVCSSNEEKYRWKGARRVEWDATPDDRRRTKYGKKAGDETLQIRANPADSENTILKMAKKRSLIDAVLTVTGTSDLLTQDMEDTRGEELVIVETETPKAPPPPAAPVADVRVIGLVEVSKQTRDGKDYMAFKVKEGEREYEATCWEPEVWKVLTEAMEAGVRCKVTVKTKDDKVKIIKAEAENAPYEIKPPTRRSPVLTGAADKVADLMEGGK